MPQNERKFAAHEVKPSVALLVTRSAQTGISAQRSSYGLARIRVFKRIKYFIIGFIIVRDRLVPKNFLPKIVMLETSCENPLAPKHPLEQLLLTSFQRLLPNLFNLLRIIVRTRFLNDNWSRIPVNKSNCQSLTIEKNTEVLMFYSLFSLLTNCAVVF